MILRGKYFVLFFFFRFTGYISLCKFSAPLNTLLLARDPYKNLILNHFHIFAHRFSLSNKYALYSNPTCSSKTRLSPHLPQNLHSLLLWINSTYHFQLIMDSFVFSQFYLIVTLEFNLCGFYIFFSSLDYKLDVRDHFLQFFCIL